MLRSSWVRRLAFTAFGAVTTLLVLVAAANVYVLLSEDGTVTSDLRSVPHAEAAIVLGAAVQPDGRMSSMLRDRVDQAAALYRAGKVDRVLVSGDHGTWAYDEPDTMRRALQARGVPGRAIFTDHAGFDTWATMVRARTIFHVRSAVVVTQGFHMARALFLAGEAGVHATGFDASLHGYGEQGVISDVRELFARVKAVGQPVVDDSPLGGPTLPITGDGHVSWGPQHPPASYTGPVAPR